VKKLIGQGRPARRCR